MTLYLFNSPILPLEDQKAIIFAKKLTFEEAYKLYHKYKQRDTIVSAIGHQATAELLSRLFKDHIPANRMRVELKEGDKVLAFTLKQRLPEGKIIQNAKELEEIGYEFIFYDVRYSNENYDKVLDILFFS